MKKKSLRSQTIRCVSTDFGRKPTKMRTIVRLLAEGIRHFAMVHDSYAVHACDVDLLHRIIRGEFVAIYSKPVLQNFLNELRKAHPDLNFPEPPRTGNLDIRQVISSPYFFA